MSSLYIVDNITKTAWNFVFDPVRPSTVHKLFPRTLNRLMIHYLTEEIQKMRGWISCGYIILQLLSGLNPSSFRCSSAASFSLCSNFSLASIGNQSFIKLSSAQSTFAGRRKTCGQRWSIGERKDETLTAIGNEHGRCPTHWTVALSSLLHLDETANAEEVTAPEADWLEGNARADDTRVVVYVGNNG